MSIEGPDEVGVVVGMKGLGRTPTPALDYPKCEDWTQEPFDNISLGSLEKLQEFHRRNPDVLRDYRLTEG